MKSDSAKLTPREALFVLKVLELDNQTEAYLQAGYRCSRSTARANAARLLTKASVRQAIAQARHRRLEAAEMDANEAMRRIAAIARADIRRLFDENGQLLPVQRWPDEAVLWVKSFKQRRWGPEIVLHDALRALELVATDGGRIKGRSDPAAAFDLEKAVAESGL